MASIKLKHSGGNGVIIAAPTSNPASDKTLTLPSDVDGTVVSKDSSNSLQNIAGINGGQLGNRNLIINGAMQVAQRGTSSTSTGYQTVDRFQIGTSGVDEAPTQAQADVAAGTTPYTLGFRKSFKVTNGNQTSGAGALDVIDIKHLIEAQDVANSGWNYLSSSSYITLSFWIKSSVAQNFFGHVMTADGTRYNYPFETGSLSADTWTKITKTISGNSNLQIDNNNGTGLEIRFAAFYGTDRTGSSATLNQWGVYDASTRTPDSTSTWYTTNDATLEITGVQLEVGSVATDFEHRSFTDELLRCHRYFVMQSGGSDVYSFAAKGQGSTSCDVGIPLCVPLRASPTIVNTSNRFFRSTTTSQSTSTTNPSVVQFSTTNSIFSPVLAINVGGHSSTNNEAGCWTLLNQDMTLDAEL